MPKRPPKDENKTRLDVNELAYRTVQAALGNAPKPMPPSERTEKNLDAVTRGRKGGLKGGAARASKLGKKERAASAKKAARARWKRSR